jgi:UDPglucose 6-dehydrogenase
MKISYINSIARICEKVGADINEVAIGIGSDHRIGEEFLDAGLGYGGSCFGKDNRALIHLAKELGFEFEILQAVEKINNQQPDYFVALLKTKLKKLKNKKIAILGLSFKPNTDDIRDSRASKIIEILKQHGVKVQAYDPKAMKNMAGIHHDILYCGSAMEAAKDADAIILVTEWSEFLNIDFKLLKSVMKTPVIFDGRNLYDPFEMKSNGFDYQGIGR